MGTRLPSVALPIPTIGPSIQASLPDIAPKTTRLPPTINRPPMTMRISFSPLSSR